MKHVMFAIIFALTALQTSSLAAETGCTSAGRFCFDPEKTKNLQSTMEWSDSYACYDIVGKCIRLMDGSCGWEQTPELQDCIKNPHKYAKPQPTPKHP